MTHMVGKDWRDFFDVIIVQADKPHFFTDGVKWAKDTDLAEQKIWKESNFNGLTFSMFHSYNASVDLSDSWIIKETFGGKR